MVMATFIFARTPPFVRKGLPHSSTLSLSPPTIIGIVRRATHEAGQGASDTETSAWMRVHISDSVYLWACGEKADEEDEDITCSDRLISWVILLMQGFAYTMLIVLARDTSGGKTSSSANGNGESGNLLPSVTGAMYLLVASTTHDLRAGFSLLVGGPFTCHRAFGMGLLILYGVMITAAMTVLVSTSADNASVVLNAVTVLFVAELDEMALKFLSTVPQRWRLFWAMQSAGMSFVLALIAIIYVGEYSPLLRGDNGVLQTWPMWFIWLVNPLATTVASVVLSSTIQASFNTWSEAYESEDGPTQGHKTVFVRVYAIISRATERFQGQPYYYVIEAIWLVQVVPNWLYMQGPYGFPFAIALYPYYTPGSQDHSFVLSDNKLVLVTMHAVLVIGVGLKAAGRLRARRNRVLVMQGGLGSSESLQVRQGWHSYTDSRVPSLLVGWGIGYWATTLLAMLICAWNETECGWDGAPIIVRVISYVIFPIFLSVSLLMVVDPDILGTRFANMVKPAVEVLKNRDRVEYWVMASVFRDSVVLWIGYCEILKAQLEGYKL